MGSDSQVPFESHHIHQHIPIHYDFSTFCVKNKKGQETRKTDI